MRYILTSLLLYVTIYNYAQVFDDFSDGNFTVGPTWIGIDSNFEINGSNVLHLIAPSVTDTSYLVTSNSLVDNTEWTTLVNLDFGTSSVNLARLYLMSDQSNLKENLNGYFVQIGGTADEVSLYKQTGSTITEIIDGTDGFVNGSNVSVRIKVVRTISGNWSLYADNAGNLNYISQGDVIDTTHVNSTHFGVFCRYTSTRSDKFYFDDVEIKNAVLEDSIPPQITNITVLSNQELELWFTERVDLVTSENSSNYSVNNGLGSPAMVELQNLNQSVKLSFGLLFQNGTDYTLSVENVQDDSGNVMPASTIHFVYNEPYFASYKDVVITEIMPDPSPVVGLPEVEYIELFNNTDKVISLENWTLSDGSTTITLSDQPFFPQTYLLCHDSQSGAIFGIFNTIEGPIPTLNNLADIIIIRDNNGLIIDSVAYTVGWYNNIQKALGGWSLELKNLNSPCHDPSNWSASENTAGGTPGYENSITTNEPNITLPKVVDAYIENDSIVHFIFNKIIDGGTVMTSPTLGQSFSSDHSEVTVILSGYAKSQFYHIIIKGFEDCWGNTMTPFTYLFAISESVFPGDILINEVLFNPSSGGTDYVELVNVSNKVFALNELILTNIDDGIIGNLEPLSNKKILMFPGNYLLLSKDSLAIIETFPNYSPGHFLEMNLPTYSNDSGTVILMNQTTILDQFSYNENLHFTLIDDLNGKALERLSFNQSSQSNDNWHSASEASGWGTPGYLNSQTSSSSTGTVEVSLQQSIFSPDNDGYQDVLEIAYHFLDPDNVMDIVIYNSSGHPVRELRDNFYPGKTGIIVWDGITDEGRKASVGTYIIGVTVFDLKGAVKRYKLVGVLATHL